jgi:hypothetical protein
MKRSRLPSGEAAFGFRWRDTTRPFGIKIPFTQNGRVVTADAGRQQRELPPPESGGSPCSDPPPRTAAHGRGPAAPKQARAETSQDIPYEGLTAGIPLA